jgi:hypothetical protein
MLKLLQGPKTSFNFFLTTPAFGNLFIQSAIYVIQKPRPDATNGSGLPVVLCDIKVRWIFVA